MRDGCGEFRSAEILQPPSHSGQVRKAKLAQPCSVAHLRRDLEFGYVQLKAGPQRLDQRLLHRPQAKEELTPAVRAGAGQPRLFRRGERLADEYVQVAASAARFHVHAQPALPGQCDQPMSTAVTDAETDGGRLPAHDRRRLPMLPFLERQFPVRASQPLAEDHPKRASAQGKLALRRISAEAAPACLLLFIQQLERLPLPLGPRREVNVYDIGVPGRSKGTPPAITQYNRPRQI